MFEAAYVEFSRASAKDYSRAFDVFYKTWGTIDFNPWRAHDEVRARMGNTLDAFRALPWARHGLTSPIESMDRGEPMTWASVI